MTLPGYLFPVQSKYTEKPVESSVFPLGLTGEGPVDKLALSKSDVDPLTGRSFPAKETADGGGLEDMAHCRRE